MLRQQIVRLYMAHSFVNIIADLFIVPLKFIQQILNINTLRCTAGRAIVFHGGKLPLLAVFFYQFLPQISQRTNNVQLTAEYSLIGHHCADFPSIKHVNQQCFNNIVPVMGKSYFITAFGVSYLKNSFAPQPRTQKTGIFLIKIRVRKIANIRLLHHIVVNIFLKIFLQRFIGPIRWIKTHIDIDSDKRKPGNKNHR